MVTIGDTAPDFTAPMAGGAAYNDIDEFVLSDALDDGPVVLAFFPAAFTGGCTEEMCAFRDSMGAFDGLNANVYGISVDLPFALNKFIEENSLTFPLVSDFNQEAIHAYDTVLPELYGLRNLARRSIFVIDEDGKIVYKWIKDEDESPDFDALVSDVAAVLEEL